MGMVVVKMRMGLVTSPLKNETSPSPKPQNTNENHCSVRRASSRAVSPLYGSPMVGVAC